MNFEAKHKAWAEAERAVVAADLAGLERLLREHPALFRGGSPQSSWLGRLAPDYSEADARAILVREHGFRSYPELEAFVAEARRAGSAVAGFEAAADAVVLGDLETLAGLLRVTPDLVRARSARMHRATLLHLVGANGIEGWRQRTPANVVRVAECLLGADAEIDALADMYGGSTTLGLVATSIHPHRAGVQGTLIDLLLDRGAAIDHPTAAGNGQGIVNGCLANGRPGAAEHLARRGSRLDLEGAAGVGRLDAVRGFFGDDGRLIGGATPAQMHSGFQWACEYGRTPVVAFLLGQGIEVGRVHQGQTGLHWAALGRHGDIARLLLAHGASVGVRDDRFHQTPLGWALHGWSEVPAADASAYRQVVAMLVAAGAVVEPNWLTGDRIRADAGMLAALRGDSGEVPGSTRP